MNANTPDRPITDYPALIPILDGRISTLIVRGTWPSGNSYARGNSGRPCLGGLNGRLGLRVGEVAFALAGTLSSLPEPSVGKTVGLAVTASAGTVGRSATVGPEPRTPFGLDAFESLPVAHN